MILKHYKIVLNNKIKITTKVLDNFLNNKISLKDKNRLSLLNKVKVGQIFIPFKA